MCVPVNIVCVVRVCACVVETDELKLIGDAVY